MRIYPIRGHKKTKPNKAKFISVQRSADSVKMKKRLVLLLAVCYGQGNYAGLSLSGHCGGFDFEQQVGATDVANGR
jgi:hypothetical protein